MLADYLVNAFATLFVTIDPVGLAPMFLAVTAGATPAVRKRVAIRAVLIGGGILFLFLVAGKNLLGALGISVPAFQIAGGLLLLMIAVEMVFEKRNRRKSETAEKAVAHQDDLHDVAVFPLAIPLIAGPAAISAVILLSSQAPDTISVIGLASVIVVIVSTCYVSFLLADRIERLLGDTAAMVITRLLGVLLAALSVQFIADGVIALIAAAA
ncbi:MarC family protein [Stappia sp. ES.058]|uniref:MarC family protein n=1 Tax=Stappia sp. ES.058 TaxID=1881061 RepID=UPI000879275E|nr:MarC family protein [Stappia sp. ES.058]SDU07494.1 multiple antibiotic resistance protein [Stappia sp. ES.058]